MQIIINQSEIETAIRNYITDRIHIKDGMQIDIDLSATRGADGFKATIDIVPTLSYSNRTVASGIVAATEKLAVKATVQPVVEPVALATTSPITAGTATDEKVEEPIVALLNTGVQEAATTSAETPAVRTSLFGGLKKPVNA